MPLKQLEALVRRLTADNPSPFTFEGTNSYIVGQGEVAVIDPGPDLPAHVDAILAATAGETVTAILCTHTHRDHSPAAGILKAATGAPIVGCAALTMDDAGPRADAAFDADYRPRSRVGGWRGGVRPRLDAARGSRRPAILRTTFASRWKRKGFCSAAIM